MRTFLVSTIAAICVSASAWGAEQANPYRLYFAEVINVIDGDNLAVKVRLWPGLVAEYSVRVRGIDAPEIRRPSCEEERSWGDEAKAQLEKLYDVGSEVRLENVAYDSFSGRVLADVSRWRSDRWLYLKDEMVERGMAVFWVPQQADVAWCLLAKTR